MIYQRYTCSLAEGGIEFGFCFYQNESDNDCCTDAEIVVGVTRSSASKLAALAQMQAGWDKYEWMAKAVVAAAPAQGATP